MPSTTHSVANHTVQVLTNKSGDSAPTTSIIVRLYDGDDNDIGTASFQDYGSDVPPPHGDPKTHRASSYMDIAFYPAFMEILRLDQPAYWKIAWVQTGPTRTVTDVSLDTKKEILGEFFPKAED